MQFRHLAQRFVETPVHSPEEMREAERLLRWVLGRKSDESVDEELNRLMTVPNKTAESGCDRCTCGCKYWENDTCLDCNTKHAELFKEKTG